MYSQYVFNGLVLNPAYAGTHDVLSAAMLYRDQWLNIPGAPKTGLLSIDAPFKSPKVGLGFDVAFDKIGVTSNTVLTGIYSYKIRFEQGSLSFGLQMGIGFLRSDFASVKYLDNSQNTVDPAFQANYHYVLPDFGIGIYYYTKKFYVGLSIPQFAGYTMQKVIYGSVQAANLDLANHYFVSSGFVLSVSPDLKLQPSVLLKYVTGAPMEMDLNGVVWFYDILGLGVSYRSLASMNFMGQIRVNNQLYIGYAYEYATNNLNTFSSGSHEIMLQYLFDFSHAKIITPRFF